jgi:tight adherence protein B
MQSTTIVLAASSALLAAAAGMGIYRMAPVWDGLAARQMGRLADRFEQLGLGRARLAWLLRCWGVAMIGVAVVLGPVVHAYPLAAIGVGLLYIAPRHILDFLVRRRTRLLSNQMVGAAGILANSVKAGLSIAQGFEVVATEAPQPLRAEFQRIVFEYQRGRPLGDAIDEVRNRLDLDGFTLFASAIKVALDRGGRINEALDRIGHSLQENERLRRKVEADTSSGRQTVLILGLFPVFSLGLFYLLDPPSVALLFQTLIGQVALVTTAIIVYLGTCWAAHIVRLDI